MRKWILPAVLLLLTVACHQKDKKRDSDNNAGKTDTPAIIDTTSQTQTIDTVNSDTQTEIYIAQRDSAEITNLRLFARKQSVIYNASLLVGEWQNGTEHEVYYSDGTGKMWDTSEDITREEAQTFEWSLDSNMLTIICKLKLGGVVPKRYVVTFADDENLSYSNHFGVAYLWDKVK